jgi:hypothetical protein
LGGWYLFGNLLPDHVFGEGVPTMIPAIAMNVALYQALIVEIQHAIPVGIGAGLLIGLMYRIRA